MRKAVVISALFHTAIFLIVVVGLPSVAPLPEIEPIPVELVNLDEELPKPPVRIEPKKAEPPPKPQPKPQPNPQQANLPPPPAPVPVTEPTPDPDAEAAPPLPDAEPEETQKPQPAPPKPKRKPDIKIAMPDKPKSKAVKEEDQPEDRLTSILRNVERLRQEQTSNPEDTQTAKTAAPRAASQIELNEITRIIQQKMASCWRLEPGARDAENLVVQVRIAFNRDGSVRKVDIVDQTRFRSDRFFRSAAENARRAILSCQPFDLPARKYDLWSIARFNFNPRQMFGG